MSRSILVTGGAGYIGSHACKALKQAGYLPVTLDNLVYGHRDFVRWGPFVQGDTRDVALIEETIRKHDIAAVMHFAAFAYVGESVVDPEKYYENNLVGTLGLLKGMRQAGCSKLVFSSTCAIYGEPEQTPIVEASAYRPVNPYGRSKLMCEQILADYAAAYDFDYVALRYFNAAGDDLDAEVGELREIETHLIPRAMMSLQGYIDDFQVFGDDFPTPDGTAIRDYIHVLDLAQGHVLALKRLLDDRVGGGAYYNLGTGTGYSVKQVLDLIQEVTGRNIPAPRGARRPGDPAILVADSSKAQAELGFAPARSDLRTIIETAWKWHLKAHPRKNASGDASLG